MAKRGKDWWLGRTPEQQQRKQDAKEAHEVRKAEINEKYEQRVATAQANLDRTNAKLAALKGEEAEKRAGGDPRILAIDAAADRMRMAFGSKREIRKLVDFLMPDEMVQHLASGEYGKGKTQGLLAATDRRLLFIYVGWTSGKSEVFGYDKVSTVEWDGGFISGTVKINASGTNASIGKVPNQDGEALVAYVRNILSAPRSAPQAQPDSLDQLKKLADLHAAGILSDDEFAAKKADLLGRI